MKYSKLKHEIELLDLNHKHSLELVKIKHEQERKQLLAKCIHKFEDGTTATSSHGTQWNSYSQCDICGKSV